MKVNNSKFFLLFFFLIFLSLIPNLLFSQVDTAWVRRYNGPGNNIDWGYCIAVDGYGNVYVTGRSYGFTNNYDYATIKYDANSNLLWARRYNGPGDDHDWANALAVDNFGNVYVTGRSYNGSSDYDYVTIKYDADGNEI